MKSRGFYFAAFLCMAFLTATPNAFGGDIYEDLQSVSVRVDIGAGCGSGVMVMRQAGEETLTFVWTAGHVVEHLRQPDGTFGKAVIYQEVRTKGRLVGKTQFDAKVIAYSDPYRGEDLAVLEILKEDFRSKEISAAFFLGDEIPRVGTELIHVGAVRGLFDSVSTGIVSQTDREIEGKAFDQTTVMGYPGSSGGGVFLRDGRCIGLLTQGVGPGLNFIVPVRRMKQWAKKTQIMWALDPTVSIPVERDRLPREADETPTLAPQIPGIEIVIPKCVEGIQAILDAALNKRRASRS